MQIYIAQNHTLPSTHDELSLDLRGISLCDFINLIHLATFYFMISLHTDRYKILEIAKSMQIVQSDEVRVSSK